MFFLLMMDLVSVLAVDNPNAPATVKSGQLQHLNTIKPIWL